MFSAMKAKRQSLIQQAAFELKTLTSLLSYVKVIKVSND